ncbi:MAG: DNA-processing protein DprA [Pseudomonadota bacterium]
MGAESDQLGWLTLLLTPNLGVGTLRSINLPVSAYGLLASRSRAELRGLGLKRSLIDALQAPDPERLQAARDWLAHPHHHLIALADPLYPPLLKQTDDPPLVLLVNGLVDVLVRPQVAIVGSRNATTGGLQHAREFATALAQAGLVITSGLALGVDGQAHQAAMDAGGQTIAVGGTGPDQVYPARHRALAHRMVEQGAVVSCFAPGVGPRPGHFPARNRIISGMSLGVLVIEAGLRSGSLITARLAGEQGREVFALPGSTRNPYARGCHQLIRQGAKLVESAEEVLDELKPLATELADRLQRLIGEEDAVPSAGAQSTPSSPDLKQDQPAQQVLRAVGFDPTPIDRIIVDSQLDTATVSARLLQLEMAGLIEAHPGGRYSRLGG